MRSVRPQDIAVSTTPNLEGWSIKSYLGVASAHVVAGTNVFSDIAASFSDIFGGQSQSYQNQLEDINEAVIDDLKDQAAQRGGTALVGLSVDHDQISGGNRQLLMVSATATVVHAERTQQAERASDRSEGEPVSARQLERTLRKQDLVQRAEEGDLTFTSDIWDFVIRHRVTEIAETVRASVNHYMKTHQLRANHKSFLERSNDYFMAVPAETAKHHLYNLLGRGNEEAAEWALDLIEERNLLDWNWIDHLLGSDSFQAQKRALPALKRAQKSTYTAEDIGVIGRLIKRIEGGFPKQGEVLEVEEEGMFGSSTKEVWQLEEGRHIDIQKDYDPKTGQDIYGFTRKETRPKEAVEALKKTRAALHEQFGDPEA